MMASINKAKNPFFISQVT